MKLLIVDDVALNRRLLRAQLELAGHVAVEAGNGIEALQAMERETVDAVISDILMPEMDGFRFCLELRKNERFASIPFLLYTSTYNSPSDRSLAEKVGADGYLTKPSPVEEIIAALAAASVRKRPPRTGRPVEENEVLRQYNEALVRKLEDKNAELTTAIEHMNELNEHLERRVEQRTQQLEAANRELEAFSYSVAHDLRSPLSAISGFMRLLQHAMEKDLSVQGRHYLEVIDANIKRMSVLIDDLLSLAQMERLELARELVDLGAIVTACIVEIREEYAGRDVEVEVGELPTCMGDAVLLHQAMSNLIGNAFKYTGKVERPRVQIGVEERHGDGVVYIRDNGAGFDMRYADQLFAAFRRLHSRSDFEGTGVGLAIVDRIIRRHGGRIWATAELGKGATFYFTLAASRAAGRT
jgi:two-component system, sensor histidine kinase and response regulator